MRILQVNTVDDVGGAAQVARALHDRFLAAGHDAWMAVGRRGRPDPRVLELRPTLLDRLLHPPTPFDLLAGRSQFWHPASRRLATLLRPPPDVVHLHNLHGRYFDFRALPTLTARRPTFVTLHDAWLTTGHCAHSFACERWLTGCGACPDLDVYPAMRRDFTAWAWRLKRDAYARSRLHVAAPCRWLMERIERSILAPAVASARVIPNGVDLDCFRPGDRAAARAALGIPSAARVVLFAAAGIRQSPFKDFRTMREAVERAAATPGDGPLLFLALGEDGAPQKVGAATIEFRPFAADRATVAAHYRAADLYLHAARADTFPNTVIEALACGTPVVATAVGGIPEQVRPLAADDAEGGEATGILSPPGDAAAMARGLQRLLADARLRARVARNAARDATRRFDLRMQTERTLQWYEEVVGTARRPPDP